MSWHNDVEGECGLNIYSPLAVNIIENRHWVQQARAALKKEGIVIVRGSISTQSCISSKSSIFNDILLADGVQLPRALNTGTRTLSCENIDKALNIIGKHIGGAHERRGAPNFTNSIPVDGLMKDNGLPLTVCAQLRRLHPGVRDVFAKIYGLESEDLRLCPEPARVVFDHMPQYQTPADIARRHSPGPVSAMLDLLGGALQPPYRMTSRTGIMEEMSKRLTRGVLPFDIIGTAIYTDSELTDADSISPSGKRAVKLGPGLVFSPGKQNIPMLQAALGPNPSTRKFRSATLCSFQELTDNELSSLRFGFVPVRAGDLVLWRRDVPFAFSRGAPSNAADNKIRFAAQHISWIPMEGRLESETLAMRLLFSKHRTTYTSIYNFKTKKLPRSKKRKRQKKSKVCLNASAILPQHYNFL